MASYSSNPFEPETRRHWPLGPNYLQLFSGQSSHEAWCRFRLVAAEWYLETLVTIFDAIHDLDRFVGVEMALDGFLSATSSAVDAAVGGLIDSLDLHAGTSPPTPDYQKTWSRAKAIAASPPVVSLKCASSFDAAMTGDHTDSPSGWLAQLRHTRNRMTHHSTLVRHFTRHVSEPESSGSFASPTEMTVPGRGQVEPISYMNEALSRTRSLVEEILKEAAAL